jgi:hypothetical protein
MSEENRKMISFVDACCPLNKYYLLFKEYMLLQKKKAFVSIPVGKELKLVEFEIDYKDCFLTIETLDNGLVCPQIDLKLTIEQWKNFHNQLPDNYKHIDPEKFVFIQAKEGDFIFEYLQIHFVEKNRSQSLRSLFGNVSALVLQKNKEEETITISFAITKIKGYKDDMIEEWRRRIQ